MRENKESFVILVQIDDGPIKYLGNTAGFDPSFSGARIFDSMQEVSKEATRLRAKPNTHCEVWTSGLWHLVPWSEVLAAAEGAATSKTPKVTSRQIIYMISQGYSVKAIREHCGCSRYAVHQAAKPHGGLAILRHIFRVTEGVR